MHTDLPAFCGAAAMLLMAAGVHWLHRYAQRDLRGYFDKLWVPNRRLEAICNRATEFRVIEGEIVPSVSPGDLIFSPLSHQACVAWSVTFHSVGRPDPQLVATTFADMVDFDVRDGEQITRITGLRLLEIPHLLDVYRRYEPAEAKDFILSQPNGEDTWRMMEFVQRRVNGLDERVFVYEHIIPPQGHCTLIAGVYDVVPTFAERPHATRRRLAIDGARAFSGTRAANEALIRRARRRSLRYNRWVSGFAILLYLGGAGFFLSFVW